jgi:hypothetical protein
LIARGYCRETPPEFISQSEHWLNANKDHALTLTELRGKAVWLQFNFCENCTPIDRARIRNPKSAINHRFRLQPGFKSIKMHASRLKDGCRLGGINEWPDATTVAIQIRLLLAGAHCKPEQPGWLDWERLI